MKKATFLTVLILSIIIVFVSSSQFSCQQPAEQKPDSTAGPKQMSKAEMISRGKYLVTSSACGDCHTPKIFTAAGPVPDSTKLLSGHPATMPILPIDKKVLKPGNWVLIGPDLTSFVGPFGMSFAANL